MKKPRKPEVVRIEIRLLTAETNAEILREAMHAAGIMRSYLRAKLVRKPTVERVGKR